MAKKQRYSSALLSVSLLATSSLASAGSLGGGIITYQPLGVGVPALGGSGLIILALLLAVVAVRLIKNQQNSGTAWLVAATCISALATGGSGIKLINDAYAGQLTLDMTEPGGGTLVLPAQFECVQVNNLTPVTQTIVEIEAFEPWLTGPCNFRIFEANGGGNGGGAAYRGTCSDEPPTILQPNTYCDILTFNNQANGGVIIPL